MGDGESKRIGPTPGPWIVSEDAEFTVEAGPGSPAEPMQIAITSDSSHFPCLENEHEEARADDEARANARLIAAAPDLLAACKWLAEAYAATSTVVSGDEEEMNKAWDAIRKAEGGAA